MSTPQPNQPGWTRRKLRSLKRRTANRWRKMKFWSKKHRDDIEDAVEEGVDSVLGDDVTPGLRPSSAKRWGDDGDTSLFTSKSRSPGDPIDLSKSSSGGKSDGLFSSGSSHDYTPGGGGGHSGGGGCLGDLFDGCSLDLLLLTFIPRLVYYLTTGTPWHERKRKTQP